jgi:methylmalonyl-CoA mutase, C-terminal domain
MQKSSAPIKVLVTILGLDQHEVGAMAIAATLRDAGMEVVYGGRFNLPPAVVNSALQEDVDVIGISAHSWEYLHFLDDIFDGLKAAGMDVPVIIGGSVVTDTDKADILSKGVTAAFGPTDTPAEIVAEIHRVVESHRAREDA